ncbi:hypothetical protein HPP92_020078 [Vanilla planifolia]|uniref:Uncharacterized protein n=1 Tax=Vanilla planifolia TaxID=51239 RepID=A0A835QA85_VANPL|nr:hypothetical protein HPP92_020078 [Vanilla planifolia]
MQQHLVFLGEKLTLKAQAMKFTLILLKNWMLLWADWWDGRLQQKFRRYIQEEELTMDSSWMLDDLSRGCLILVTEELQKLNERMESAVEMRVTSRVLSRFNGPCSYNYGTLNTIIC